jgi:putative transcriptional regulator
MIIYKDILGKLKDAGYNTTRIRKENLISEKTLQHIRHNEPINTTTIDKICELTGFQPADLLEYKMKKGRA